LQPIFQVVRDFSGVWARHLDDGECLSDHEQCLYLTDVVLRLPTNSAPEMELVSTASDIVDELTLSQGNLSERVYAGTKEPEPNCYTRLE